MTIHSRLPALLLLSALALMGPAAVAQAPSVESGADEPLLQEAGALRAAIEKAAGDITELRTRLGAAEGEEALVLQGRIREARLEGLADLRALAENLAEQEQAGLDTEELGAFLEPRLQEVEEAARRIIDELEEAASEAAAGRESAGPAELEALEQQLARGESFIDRCWEARAANLEDMKALGLPVDEVEASLQEELPERAETIAGRIGLALEQREDLTARLSNAPEDADLQAELRALEQKLDGSAASLESLVTLLKEQGLDTTDYQSLLIEATGTVSTELLDTKVVLSLTQKWLERGKAWLAESGPNLILKIFIFLLILFVFRILAKIIRRVVHKALSSSRLQLSKLLQDLVVNLSSRAVMLLGLLVALSQIGFSLGPLLAGLGVAGFIVGFALQDTLGNFAAGAMILLYRPFDVGDLVEAGGVFGKVEKMTLVSTTILTLDYQTLIVPNSKIWGDVIKNVTAQKIRRVDMTFSISYSDDIPHAEKVLETILTGHEKVLKDPAPAVHLHNLGDSSVDFVVRPWVNTADYWEVYWDVTREVKMRFDSEGISIPFPQSDVHLFSETSEESESAAG